MNVARLFWGLVFLVVGVLLLLANTGFLGWQMVWAVLELWPLLLILGGLLILLRGKPPVYTWIAVIAVFVIGALLLVFAGLGRVSWDGREYRYDYRYQYRYPGARGEKRVEVPWEKTRPKAASLKLDFFAQRLELAGDSGLQQALTGDLGYWGLAPELRYTSNGDRLDITITQNEIRWPRFWGPRPTDDNTIWRLRLSDKTAWDIDIDTGASDSVLDLSVLRLRTLKVNTGANRLVVRFGDTGGTVSGKIDSGVSDIRLEIPPEVGVRLRVDGALVNSNIEGMGLMLDGKTYRSSNFDKARTKVDLELDIGLSNLTLVRGGGSV